MEMLRGNLLQETAVTGPDMSRSVVINYDKEKKIKFVLFSSFVAKGRDAYHCTGNESISYRSDN